MARLALLGCRAGELRLGVVPTADAAHSHLDKYPLGLAHTNARYFYFLSARNEVLRYAPKGWVSNALDYCENDLERAIPRWPFNPTRFGWRCIS